MTNPSDNTPTEIDTLLYAPARLRIMTVLQNAGGSDFRALQRFTGLSKSNLSKQLSRLEEAGLIEIRKRFEGKRPVTGAFITEAGRSAIDEHWRQLELLREEAKYWSAPDTPEEITGKEESVEEIRGHGSEE